MRALKASVSWESIDVPEYQPLTERQPDCRKIDHLRRALLWEPRGHFDMYVCVLMPPVTPGADLGVLSWGTAPS